MKKILFVKGGAPYSLENKVKECFPSAKIAVASCGDDISSLVGDADSAAFDFCLQSEEKTIKSVVKALKLYAKVTLSSDYENGTIVIEGADRRIVSVAEGGERGREVVDEERISFIDAEKILRSAYAVAERSARDVKDVVGDKAYNLTLVADEAYGIDKAYVAVLSEIVGEYGAVRTSVVDICEYVKKRAEYKGVVVAPKYAELVKDLAVEDGEFQVEFYLGRDNRAVIVPRIRPPYFYEDKESYERCVETAKKFSEEFFGEK